MKRIFILISFIFIFLSCCVTSLNNHIDFNKQGVFAEQQLENIEFSSKVERNNTNSEYYIVGSTQLNLSQIFSNLFGGICGAIENNNKFGFQFQKFIIKKANNTNYLKISGLLNPRAP